MSRSGGGPPLHRVCAWLAGALLASVTLGLPSPPAVAEEDLALRVVGGGVGDADVKKAVRALEPLAEGGESSRVREAASRALSQLDGRRAPAAAPLPPPVPIAPVHQPYMVAWGGFVDPLGQCDIFERDDRIEIGVPAGAYDLSIELGQTTAPRLLRPVEGDLLAEVTVDGLPEPGPTMTGPPRRGYHGAGLLLWQDERSYVRLESAVYRSGDSIVRYALFEVRRNGKPVAGLARPDVRLQGGPTRLRLQRRDRELVAMARQKNGAWREAGRMLVDLPRNLQVGIAVVNTAQSALRTAFRDFELVGERGTVPLADQPPVAAEAPATDEVGPPSLDYDSPPKPARITKPRYPQEALVKKIEGTVIVEILIDASGHVAKSRVIQSVPGLDEAALQCVRKWRFRPAVKDGEAVATIAHAPIAFRLDK